MDDDQAVTTTTAAKLMTHEAICAERYKNLLDQICKLDASITEMKAFAFRAAYYIGFGMITVLGWLIVHYVLGK